MGNLIHQIAKRCRNYMRTQWQLLLQGIRQYWFRVAILGLVVFVLLKKDLSFQLDLSAAAPIAIALSQEGAEQARVQPVTQSILPLQLFSEAKPAPVAEKVAVSNNLGNTYSNMLFDQKGSGRSKSPKATAKRKKQIQYIKRFSKVAQGEMKKFGIPASIKLAQGLIESNAGESRLSVKNNNHFGIKCFSKRCKKGHCANFTDDSHKDFFRKYGSAWESYRSHSLMLNGKRYAHLKKLGNQYKLWAHGLKKAGYATDKYYAQKLIHLIEDFELDRFDVIITE